MISLVLGVPALSIGLGAMILLSSYLAGQPIGSAEFYRIELVRVEETDSRGQIVVGTPAEHILPSAQLLVMIAVGMCCGGLGIHLSRRRWRHRRVATSAAGMIACAIAFFLAWTLFAWAAYR
ncbi:MAG: hypothetical protein ACHRXM_25025 [Isosphaerales bacterium]